MLGYAALDWEEYAFWWRSQSEESYKKTLVIYGGGNNVVVGKVVVQLSKASINANNSQVNKQ